MEKKGINLVVLVFILLIMVVLEGVYIVKLRKTNKNDNESNIIESENSVIENDETNQDENNEFKEKMVSYILDSIKVYAENGYILKSTTGDVTAEKLSRSEAIERREEFKEKIEQLVDDRNYFGEIYEKDDVQECTFNFENILLSLELGTHQGTGIGIYDSNGNKIYRLNNEEIETSLPTNSNVIEYFNEDPQDMVYEIEDEIKEDAENGILVDKENDEVISKESLEQSELENDIIDLLNDINIFTEIIYEENTLKVYYDYLQILDALNYKTTEGIEKTTMIYEFK